MDRKWTLEKGLAIMAMVVGCRLTKYRQLGALAWIGATTACSPCAKIRRGKEGVYPTKFPACVGDSVGEKMAYSLVCYKPLN